MFSLFLSLALHAQPAEAPQLDADGRTIHVEVFDDFDGDGVEDRAYISESAARDDLDLTIEASTAGRFDYPGLIWGRFEWGGQEPDLTLTGSGSLVLHTMNESMGRSRWSQRVTIAYRDGAFRRAGVTYEWRDTLNLAVGGNCDVNLLTGRGVRNDVPFTTGMPAQPVSEGIEELPAECRAWEADPEEFVGDVDNDGQPDRIILQASEHGMSSSLTLQTSSAGEHHFPGVIFGVSPEITVTDRGSVIVHSWTGDNHEVSLTIVFREQQFLVGGLTTSWRERYDSEFTHTCDVNFLTGRGVLDGAAIATDIGPVPLDEWQGQAPPGCEI